MKNPSPTPSTNSTPARPHRRLLVLSFGLLAVFALGTFLVASCCSNQEPSAR